MDFDEKVSRILCCGYTKKIVDSLYPDSLRIYELVGNLGSDILNRLLEICDECGVNKQHAYSHEGGEERLTSLIIKFKKLKDESPEVLEKAEYKIAKIASYDTRYVAIHLCDFEKKYYCYSYYPTNFYDYIIKLRDNQLSKLLESCDLYEESRDLMAQSELKSYKSWDLRSSLL